VGRFLKSSTLDNFLHGACYPLTASISSIVYDFEISTFRDSETGVIWLGTASSGSPALSHLDRKSGSSLEMQKGPSFAFRARLAMEMENCAC
jgi:hypothetical protein